MIRCSRLLLFFLIFLVGSVGYSEAKSVIGKGYNEESKGNFGTAVEFYEKGLRENPDNLLLYFKIGQIYKEKLQNYKKAIKIYESGLEHFPKNFELNVYLMQAFFDIGENERGNEMYKIASKFRGKNDMYFYPREVAYKLQKELTQKQFIEFCNSLLKLNPTDVVLREMLSIIYINTGNVLKAKEHLEALLEYEKEEGFIFFNLGLCYYNLNQYKKAYQLLLKARELGYNFPEQYIEGVKNKIDEENR